MTELAALLQEAGRASPMHRIEWRDRIAAHGARAIRGVQPWLEDPVLAAFAVRVIERAGTNGEIALATQVLRSARSKVPERVKGDVRWALQQIRARSQPVVETPVPPVPPRAVTPAQRAVWRERPHFSTVARRRAR